MVKKTIHPKMLGTQIPMKIAAISYPKNQRATDARSDKIAPVLKRISPLVRFMTTTVLIYRGVGEELRLRVVR